MLLVASVLASMRWLLCGGDSYEKEEKNDVCNFKKNVPRENLSPLRFFINSKKLNRTELRILRIQLSRKTIKSAPRISVIIFGEMVCSHKKMEARRRTTRLLIACVVEVTQCKHGGLNRHLELEQPLADWSTHQLQRSSYQTCHVPDTPPITMSVSHCTRGSPMVWYISFP